MMDALQVYFELGFHHLTEAGAWDHQLFLATLVLAYGTSMWRRWIVMATLFAIGHSLSIVLMTMDIIPTGITWVEPAIAISIVLLALIDFYFLQSQPYGIRVNAATDTIRKPEPVNKNLVLGSLALVFGTIHGLGFGGAFNMVLANDASVGDTIAALVSFTLGVEAAQLLILAVYWVISLLIFDLLQYKPLLLRKIALILIALAALTKLV